MATEKCQMCGDLGTPWSYVKELNGHVCQDCDAVLWLIEQQFESMITALSQEKLFDSDKTLEEIYSPRMIKKGLYATIRKWCQMHYVKHDTDTTIDRYHKQTKDFE